MYPNSITMAGSKGTSRTYIAESKALRPAIRRPCCRSRPLELHQHCRVFETRLSAIGVRRVVDLTGFEPALTRCKRVVFPLSLKARGADRGIRTHYLPLTKRPHILMCFTGAWEF